MKSTPFAIMVAAALTVTISASAAPPAPAVDQARVPLSFEPNRGQTTAEVRFLSRGAGYTLFLMETGAVFALPTGQAAPSPASIAMRLVGANRGLRMEGLQELLGKVPICGAPIPSGGR